MKVPAAPSLLLRALAVNARLLASERGFHVAVTGFLLTLLALRVLLFPFVGGDDGEQLIFAQQLALGYHPRNPPLYTWLVIAAEQLFGTGALALAAVKFSLLWLSYVLLYRSARIVLNDPRLAALAALSPLAIYFVAWDALLGFSHSVLELALCLATFYCLLRLRGSPGASWHLALGASLGLGLLAKYGYGLFALALLGAALTDGELRRRLWHRRALTTLAVAAALVAPYALWLLQHRAEVSAGPPQTLWRGLAHGGKAVVGFLTPLWLLLLLFFPRAFWPLPRAASEVDPFRRLLAVHLLLLLALITALIAISGLRVRGYYMVVFILVPLYLFTRVRAAGCGEGALRGYAGVLAGIALVVMAALPVKSLAEPLWCRGCELHLPYPAFAARLRAAGFVRGTIVADWYPYPLAGNFKLLFPGARVIDVKHPKVIAPLLGGGQCLLVWSRDARRGDVVSVAVGELGAVISSQSNGAEIEAPIAGTSRTVRLSYLLIESGSGDCR